MKRVLVLGGGFGGIAAARRLRTLLMEKDEVILVDRRSEFMVGFRKTWALVGETTLEAGQRPLSALERQGIQVIRGTVTAIDAMGRAAEVDGGRLEADALVIALGAELAPQKIPGLLEHSYNVYSRTDIPRAAQAVSSLEQGKVIVGIFGAPYKCPAAPYEIALRLKQFFEMRRDRVELEVFTPQPMSLPILGVAGCNTMETFLTARGITFFPNRRAVAVDEGQVEFANERRGFDLLLAIPPHQVPYVLKQSGMIDQGDWVRVNPRTCETEFGNVFAVGDVVEIPTADRKHLPKAGVFAEAMGEIAAERIAANFRGAESQAEFAGEGGCYLEVGDGKAMMVQGKFLAEPAPQVILTDPSERLFEEKKDFERVRLSTWF